MRNFMNSLTPTTKYISELQQRNPNLITVSWDDLCSEIDFGTAIRNIWLSDAPEQEKKDALAVQFKNRLFCLHHVPLNNALTKLHFFCNMNQIGLAPTPLSSAYKQMRLPTVSIYATPKDEKKNRRRGGIAGNIASISLSPAAIQYVPKCVQKEVGTLSGKQVDCFLTVVDARFLNTILFEDDRHLSLCTHHWAYPNTLRKDDVKGDVLMGIFPEVGVSQSKSRGGIAFNQLSPMLVHSHPDDEGLSLYSPDNAHFKIIPGSPFATFWATTCKGNRIALTKMLVILEGNHPISAHLVNTVKNSCDLGHYLKTLGNISFAIDDTFHDLIQLLDIEDPQVLDTFHLLPKTFQYGIYEQAWILFKSPKGYVDFGKASFENEPGLDKKYHCTNQQRKQAVYKYCQRLNSLLYQAQVDLTQNSQDFIKGENALRMMQCAQLFKHGKIDEAVLLFSHLLPEEQKAARYALWEICRCPRFSTTFGGDAFASLHVDPNLKAEALILAASRQALQRDEPFSASRIEPLQQSVAENTAAPQFIVPTGLSPEQVIEALTSLVVLDAFVAQSPGERKRVIDQFLSQLPDATRTKIYKLVCTYSTDPNRSGQEWAKEHIADDLCVLVNVLQSL
jgi:hypothetical protein